MAVNHCSTRSWNIDLNPSDMNCGYSTLLYISTHARRHNVAPIVTFDQPLWFKAAITQTSVSPDNGIISIVVRLGGFHTQMSLLGVIGIIIMWLCKQYSGPYVVWESHCQSSSWSHPDHIRSLWNTTARHTSSY